MQYFEQLSAVDLFGARQVVVAGRRFEEPAVGVAAVRALLRAGQVQRQDVVLRALDRVAATGPGMRLFLANREVVKLPDEMGGKLEARPIIPGLDVDTLSNYGGSDDGENRYICGVIDESARVYKLNILFHDTTITDKLQISERRLQSAKRLALSDPSAAAASLGEYVRAHGFPNAKITAGDYAKNVSSAIDFVHRMGRTITYRDPTAPAMVTADTLDITFDNFCKDPQWTVTGPLRYAREINIVYQLAIHHGPDQVLFMLANETVRLRINIRNEKTGLYYSGEVNGYSSMAGIQPVKSGFPSELTADQQTRLLAAGKKVLPVMVGDAVIGSAVQVSDKHVILNEHTLTAAEVSDTSVDVCGLPVLESMSVAGDVCVVRRDGKAAQWLFRDPEVGERVVLCYSVGQTVEYSEVLRVVACADQLVLSGSNVLRRGASGAAVIALRDSALLGIFSTMRSSRVYCALFTSSSFAVVSDYQSVVSMSDYTPVSADDTGTHTYSKMVKRGFMGFMKQISECVAPLYIRQDNKAELAGLVANIAGVWHTTVDPDSAQLGMADGRLLSFRSAAFNHYAVLNPPPVLQAVPNLRAVEPGERVFVFTKADSDAVIMSSVRIVTHCFADGVGFVVEDFGDSAEVMIGGLIVAERDAAVVGQYVVRDCDVFGQFSVKCVAFSSSATVPSLVVPGSLPSRSAVIELVDWVAPSEAAMHDFASYGRQVLAVVAGKHAYSVGQALSKGSLFADDAWNGRRNAVLDSLGWLPHADSLYERYDKDVVAFAFLALTYIHDTGGTVLRLTRAMHGLSEQNTPVVADFPPLRPPSATGSVTSVRTQVALDDSRLRELEERLLTLTDMMSARDIRSGDAEPGL